MLRLIGSFTGYDKETGKQILEERYHSSALNTRDDALSFLYFSVTSPRVSSVTSISVLEKMKTGTYTDGTPMSCNKAQAIQLLNSLQIHDGLAQVCVTLAIDGVPCTLSAQFASTPEESFAYSLAHERNVNSAAFMQEAELEAIRKKEGPKPIQKEPIKNSKLSMFLAWLFK